MSSGERYEIHMFFACLAAVYAGPAVQVELDEPLVTEDLVSYMNSVQSDWFASIEWGKSLTMSDGHVRQGP